MPFEVVHPRDFPARFGLAKVPTRSTLKRWRQDRGFPLSLDVPRGHYRADEVAAWFASAPKKPAKQDAPEHAAA
jgi:hypothetical protein